MAGFHTVCTFLSVFESRLSGEDADCVFTCLRDEMSTRRVPHMIVCGQQALGAHAHRRSGSCP